jgi:hypothetical protein
MLSLIITALNFTRCVDKVYIEMLLLSRLQQLVKPYNFKLSDDYNHYISDIHLDLRYIHFITHRRPPYRYSNSVRSYDD